MTIAAQPVTDEGTYHSVGRAVHMSVVIGFAALKSGQPGSLGLDLYEEKQEQEQEQEQEQKQEGNLFFCGDGQFHVPSTALALACYVLQAIKNVAYFNPACLPPVQCPPPISPRCQSVCLR